MVSGKLPDTSISEDIKRTSFKSTSIQYISKGTLQPNKIHTPIIESFHTVPMVIGVNKDEDHLLVGGKNMLKLYEITQNKKLILKDKDLPEKFRQLSRSIIKDIAWNPCTFIHNNYIVRKMLFATANTERKIITFDFEAQGKTFVYKDAHDRMINKLIWDPKNENCFLTVSSDKQMKLFDNVSETAVITLTNKSDGYLDAKFTKQDLNILAAAKDNGEIEIWDMRMPGSSIIQDRLHMSSVSSLDWNTNGLLLSGSTDKHIKVHKFIAGHKLEQVMDINNYANIGIVKWQEEYNFTVSFTQLNETSVFEYNLLFPHSPIRIYKGHTDVVTDFAWIDQYLLTSSKDNTLMLRHKENSICPLLNVNAIGMGFTLNNTFAYSNAKFFPKVIKDV